MDFMVIAERLGVPVALLIVFCWFAFRIVLWVGKEVVKPIAISHIALVEQTEKATLTNTETLKKMTDIMGVQSKNVDVLRRDVLAINGKLDTVLKVKP